MDEEPLIGDEASARSETLMIVWLSRSLRFEPIRKSEGVDCLLNQ